MNTSTGAAAKGAGAVAAATGAGARTVATTETFALHAHARNVNPSTQEGLKLFLKATEEFSKEDKLDLSIKNTHVMKNHLETCSHKFSWGALLNKVPNGDGTPCNIIRNYKDVTIANVLCYNNARLGD